MESNQVGVLNARSDGGDDVDWFKLDLTGMAAATDVIIHTDGARWILLEGCWIATAPNWQTMTTVVSGETFRLERT